MAKLRYPINRTQEKLSSVIQKKCSKPAGNITASSKQKMYMPHYSSAISTLKGPKIQYKTTAINQLLTLSVSCRESYSETLLIHNKTIQPLHCRPTNYQSSSNNQPKNKPSIRQIAINILGEFPPQYANYPIKTLPSNKKRKQYKNHKFVDGTILILLIIDFQEVKIEQINHNFYNDQSISRLIIYQGIIQLQKAQFISLALNINIQILKQIKIDLMIGKNVVVKTPIELQLQKINLFNLQQYQNIELVYHLLRALNQILTTNPQIANSSIFHALFNHMQNFGQIQALRMLPLFQNLSYNLWNNQNLTLQLRQKTNFYKIVSNWIINFELRSGKLDTIESQFDLILTFMAKQTNTALERMVMINEIFQDLKDLIIPQFWEQQQKIQPQFLFSPNKLKAQTSIKSSQVAVEKVQECSEQKLNTILKIIQVLQSIMNPVFCKMDPKCKMYKNCTYGNLILGNVRQFIKKSIYFILKQGTIPTHLQTELTKISLIYLQSLQIQQSEDILNLLKHLMLCTSKAVRFALIVEYVQFYQYLELMGFQNVIEQLQNIIYFRQLIIGKKIVQQSIAEMGNKMNDLNLSYHELYIKAGTAKKIYFSNQNQDCVLKLEILLQENDINMKIAYLDNIQVISRPAAQNKFIFETVIKMNQFDGSKLKQQKIYWKQQKGTSKKLELKLQYLGLYYLQFDNTYSWVIPKNIKYRIQMYQPLK